MNIPQIYIMIVIVVLAIIGALIFFLRKNKETKKLTPVAGLALVFILAGMAFFDNRIIGYSLMGIGIILAVVDIIKKK